MKRLLPFLIIISLILLSAACGGKKETGQALGADIQTEGSDAAEKEVPSENPQPLSDASGESIALQEETGVDALVKALNDNDYSVTLESVGPQLLRGDCVWLSFTGPAEGRVTIYEYRDAAQAQEDAACIDTSGSTITWPDQTQYIEWKSVPHFWNQDNMIIQYIGVDEAVLRLLTELYGEQFAGGFDGPG